MGRKKKERQPVEELFSTAMSMLVPAHILEYFEMWDAQEHMLSELELLRRVRYAITQSPNKWSENMKNTISQVFEKHNDLKTAYQISQNFKHWYDYQNHIKSKEEIKINLYKWYEQARQVT